MNEDCLKLTTYFGERDRTDRQLLADELLDLYGAHQIQSSILLRGIEGFGAKHQMHTDLLLSAPAPRSPASFRSSVHCSATPCSRSSGSASASATGRFSQPPTSCPAPMSTAWRCGRS
jgi:hypothetical protein